MIRLMAMTADEVGVLLRTTPQQRADLRAEAAERGLSVQELLELKVFGEIRPRVRKRRRGPSPMQERLIA